MVDLIVSENVHQTLAELETVIGGGLEAFVEVGQALARIRDDKLYRLEEYDNFRDYCRIKWNLGKSRVYQLIDAARVAENVSTNGGQNLFPLNERHCRELGKLETPELQRQALNTVINNNGNDKITASQIERVVREMKLSDKPPLIVPPQGTVVRIAGNNPDLKHLWSCWGIVTESYEYSCDVETCLGKAKTVHPQYLMRLVEVEYLETAIILNRVKKIYQQGDRINFTVRHLLEEIATQPIPELNEWQEVYLKTTESKLANSI